MAREVMPGSSEKRSLRTKSKNEFSFFTVESKQMDEVWSTAGHILHGMGCLELAQEDRRGLLIMLSETSAVYADRTEPA